MDRIDLKAGEAVLMDGCGGVLVLTLPEEQLGVVLDMAGRWNKLETRSDRRYLMAPGQAGELAGRLTRICCTDASRESTDEFRRGFNLALEEGGE